MKKKSKKVSKKGIEWDLLNDAFDCFNTSFDIKNWTGIIGNGEMIAPNYKLQFPSPTKQQEQDFVDNLKPSEKEYTEFELRPHESADNARWDGIVYNHTPDLIERFLVWLLNKYTHASRPNLDNFLD